MNIGIRGKSYRATTGMPFGLERVETLSAFTVCLYVIMISMFHLMRNLHSIFEESELVQQFSNKIEHDQEIEPSLMYTYMRLGISLCGLMCFIEYAFFHSIEERSRQYDKFVEQYGGVIERMNRFAYFDSHYGNMHGLCLFFFAELLLNIGQVMEYMLSSLVELHAVSVVVLTMTLFVIYYFIKPLLLASAYSLLLAQTDDYKPYFTQLTFIEGVASISFHIWGALPTRTSSCIINIELHQPQLASVVRQQVKSILNDKFHSLFININSL